MGCWSCTPRCDGDAELKIRTWINLFLLSEGWMGAMLLICFVFPCSALKGDSGVTLQASLWKSYPLHILEVKLVTFTDFSCSLSTLFTPKPKCTVGTEDQRKIVRQRIFSSSTFRSVNIPEIFVSQIKISLYPREWREANSFSQHAAGVPGLVGTVSPRYCCFVLQWCSSSAPRGLAWREIRQLVLMENPKCQP